MPQDSTKPSSDTNKTKTAFQRIIRDELGLPKHNYIKVLHEMAIRLNVKGASRSQLPIQSCYAIARHENIALPSRESLKNIKFNEHKINKIPDQHWTVPTEAMVKQAKTRSAQQRAKIEQYFVTNDTSYKKVYNAMKQLQGTHAAASQRGNVQEIIDAMPRAQLESFRSEFELWLGELALGSSNARVGKRSPGPVSS